MSISRHVKKQIIDHLWGPVGSIILHALIIYALVHFVVFDTRDVQPDIEVTIMEMETVDIEDLLDELEPELDPLDVPDDHIDAPDVDVDMDVPDDRDFVQDDPDVDFDALNVMVSESPLVMRGLLAGRTEGGRARGLREFGGSEETEAAVRRALEWLRIHQNADGSWDHGARAAAAMTGMALLTYLAHGETTDSERYGRTIRRAIEYLISIQGDDGNFARTGSNHVYGQGLAVYALAEAYAMTRIPAIKPAMDKGVRTMLDGQQRRGGWDYEFAQGARRDTSVAAFFIQALKAAELAGSEYVDEIREAMDLSVQDVKTTFNPEHGSFGYTEPGGAGDRAQGITAIGVLIHQLAGHGRDDEVRAAMDMLRERTSADWDNPERYTLYRWYYITQAMFQTGGQTWRNWNRQFAPALVENQNEDGSWTSPAATFEAGGGREVNRGPVYSTAFAALTLQVYYRILPTFAVIEDREPEEEDPDDDIVIEII